MGRVDLVELLLEAGGQRGEVLQRVQGKPLALIPNMHMQARGLGHQHREPGHEGPQHGFYLPERVSAVRQHARIHLDVREAQYLPLRPIQRRRRPVRPRQRHGPLVSRVRRHRGVAEHGPPVVALILLFLGGVLGVVHGDAGAAEDGDEFGALGVVLVLFARVVFFGVFGRGRRGGGFFWRGGLALVPAFWRRGFFFPRGDDGAFGEVGEDEFEFDAEG